MLLSGHVGLGGLCRYIGGTEADLEWGPVFMSITTTVRITSMRGRFHFLPDNG